MTKDERIIILERCVSDLSRRVRALEARPQYPYYPQYTYPYVTYGNMTLTNGSTTPTST